MPLLPLIAAVSASFGWASGSVLAQAPARALGAFEFTRIQLIACAALIAAMVSALGLWHSVTWNHWPAFLASSALGILLGNLAMIECLRRGGPRRTELILSLKAPLVAAMAFVWLHEAPSPVDICGAMVTLAGIGLAVAYGSNAASDSDTRSGSMALILLLGVTATALQGFGFLVLKPAMQAGTHPLAATAIRLLGAALLISLIALWPARPFRNPGTQSPQLLGRTILPGVIGYCIASPLLLFAMANMEAGIAAVLGALSPVLVLPILWIKEGLAPRPLAILGATFAVVGSGLILAG